MEPASLKIIEPSGDVVAQLIVHPAMPVFKIKRQIAGIEGTAASNQILMFEDRPLHEHETCSTIGLNGTGTLLLLKRAPLLSGALNCSDLNNLLADDRALEEAIGAFSDKLQYSPSEVTTIASAVSVALLPQGSEAIASGDAQHLMSQNGRARHAAFTSAVRAELERIATMLPQQSDSGSIGECAVSDEACNACGDVPLATTSPEDMQSSQGEEVRSMPMPEQSVEAGPSCLFEHRGPSEREHVPWMGAGRELQEKLHRRWSACESLSKTATR